MSTAKKRVVSLSKFDIIRNILRQFLSSCSEGARVLASKCESLFPQSLNLFCFGIEDVKNCPN